jgi:hypothetical protein
VVEWIRQLGNAIYKATHADQHTAHQTHSKVEIIDPIGLYTYRLFISAVWIITVRGGQAAHLDPGLKGIVFFDFAGEANR